MVTRYYCNQLGTIVPCLTPSCTSDMTKGVKIFFVPTMTTLNTVSMSRKQVTGGKHGAACRGGAAYRAQHDTRAPGGDAVKQKSHFFMVFTVPSRLPPPAPRRRSGPARGLCSRTDLTSLYRTVICVSNVCVV